MQQRARAKEAVIRASDLQRSVGQVLKRVAVGGERLVIERDGYPVAVLVPYQEYDQERRERALALHRELVIAMGQEMERQGLTEEQLMAELEQSKREVFEERYGKALKSSRRARKKKA